MEQKVEETAKVETSGFLNKIFIWIKKTSSSFLGIKDTPHAIAGGLGLGLFLGVLPGTGAVAAMVMAWLLRVNKAAALAGALLVNTWINFVAFPLALFLGSLVTGSSPLDLSAAWTGLFKAFSWSRLLDAALLKTVIALVGGYLVIGLVLGLIGYALARGVLAITKPKPGMPV